MLPLEYLMGLFRPVTVGVFDAFGVSAGVLLEVGVIVFVTLFLSLVLSLFFRAL